MKQIISTRGFLCAAVASCWLVGVSGVPVVQAGEPSLGKKIGQMLVVGFLGSKAGDKWPKRLAGQIRKGEVGGVVFLGHNFKSRAGVAGLTKLFRQASPQVPVFLALDMEGGYVQRLGAKLGYPKVPPALTIARSMSPQQARAWFDKLAAISASAGFNVNLGPVVDLYITPKNPVVGKWKRAYSASPQKVAAYARQFVAAHRKKRILAVLKHFPGHGSSLTDSHAGFVDISKTWKAKELKPFSMMIKSGDAPAIMPGHLIVKNSKGLPASLSRQVIAGTLRGKLGYRGLVMSDDLQMSAIRKNFSYKKALVLAINAGVDVLMISNSAKPDIDIPRKTISIIKKAVRSGKISTARINTAYRRIMAAKKSIRR